MTLLAFAALCSVSPVAAQSPPEPPAGFDAPNRTGDSTIYVSWQGSPTSGVTYNVNWTSDGGWSWTRAVSDVSARHTTITGLEAAKTYIVAVQAWKDGLGSSWINSQAFGPVNPVPATPTSVNVTRSDGSLTVTGYSVSGADKYHITYSVNGAWNWVSAADPDDNHSATSITISGVDNNATYVVGVRAGNATGWSGWRNSSAIAPQTLAGPASVVGYRGSDGKGFIDAEWSAVTGATGYDVEFGLSGYWWKRGATNVTGTSARLTDPDSPVGIPNYFWHVLRVRARDDKGAGLWSYSGEIHPVTVPLAVTNLSASRSGNALTVSWTQCDISNAECNGGTPITGWRIDLSQNGGATWSQVKTLTSYTSGSNVAITLSGEQSADQRVVVSVRTRFGENQTSAEVAIPGLPAKPASVNAYRGQGFIDAEWSAVTGATGYDVRKSWNGGISWTTVAGNLNATKFKIIDSTHHTAGEITVAVRARENNAIGPWKNSAPARGIQNPHWVTNLATARTTSGEIDVFWNICDFSDGSCTGHTPITHYAVNLSADSGKSWTRIKNVPATAADPRSGVSTVIEGVSDSQAYIVAVASMNRLGGIWQNANAPAATQAQAQTSTKLTSTTTQNASQVTTTLYWEKPAGASAAQAFSYEIECSAQTSGNDWTHTPCPPDIASTSNQSLSSSVTYTVSQQNSQSAKQSQSSSLGYAIANAQSQNRIQRMRVQAVSAGQRSLWLSSYPEVSEPAGAGAQYHDGALKVWWNRPVSVTGDYAYDVQCTTSSSTPYTWSDCHTEAASQTANFYVSPSVTGTATNVRIRASQAQRVSGWVSIGVPSGTAPAAPGNIAVSSVSTVGTTVTYTIGWDKPSGASGDLSYVVQCSSDNSTWSQCATVAATSSASLTATTTLTTSQTAWTHVRVRADQGYLRGAWSSSASTVSLSAGSITATSATLTIAGHTAAWYYKSTTTGQTTCTSVAANTSSVTLSDLSPGASYTFSAYSDSACTTANLMAAAAAFTTPLSLTASAIADTTTTLTIAGHTAQWWYKANAAPHTTCQGPVAANTAAVDLTGLTAGAAYIYKAYSDSGCATELASETFSTHSLTASAIADTTATLTIANHTAAWYYKADIAPHTTCQGPVAANTAAVDLTGLTAGAAYAYDAYSDSTCSTKLASASFTTLASLTADWIDHDSARLTIAGHTGNWYVKKTVPTPVGTCSGAIGGTTYNQGSLTAGTSYTYDAYSDSTCSTKIASVSFTTLASSLSAPWVNGPTSTTLTIADHTGNWYVKQTSPTVGTCSSASSTTTQDVSGLTSVTVYEYHAYSDAACTTAIARVAFATIPHQPQNVTHSGTCNWLGICGLTVSWERSDNATAGVKIGYEVQNVHDWKAWKTVAPTTSDSLSVNGTAGGISNTRVKATLSIEVDGRTRGYDSSWVNSTES